LSELVAQRTALLMQLRELLANLFHVFERVVFEHRHKLLDGNRHMVQFSLKGDDAVRVLFQLGSVDADGGDDVQVVYEAGEHEVLNIQVVEVPPVRAAVPGMRGVAREIVCPRTEATFPGLVLRGIVVTHRPAADGAPGDFLEQVRVLFAFSAPLAFPAEKRHVLHPCEQCRVNDFRVVGSDNFLPLAALIGFELGDIVADNSTITQ